MGWRRSWLAVARKRPLIAAIGIFAHNDRCRLDTLAIQYVTDDGDECVTTGFDGARADLEWKLGTILAPAEELRLYAHRRRVKAVHMLHSLRYLLAPKEVGNQMLQAPADDLVVRIAELSRDLSVREQNHTRLIEDDHGIRRGVERAAGEFGWREQHNRRTLVPA